MYGLYLLLKELENDPLYQALTQGKKSVRLPLQIKPSGNFGSYLPEPITDFKGEHNVKPRLVYCNQCHYEIMTDKAGPRCGVCHSYLIVCPKV